MHLLTDNFFHGILDACCPPNRTAATTATAWFKWQVTILDWLSGYGNYPSARSHYRGSRHEASDFHPVPIEQSMAPPALEHAIDSTAAVTRPPPVHAGLCGRPLTPDALARVRHVNVLASILLGDTPQELLPLRRVEGNRMNGNENLWVSQ
ncbi:hypothetical protein Q31a_61490 [Aureliella helgolandensis]|uniref:Uncharacterized protein n=1 Tax=Aureliella helgolandensis TaxID=2527968 RepID=A0A518GGN6_9BACT|nr:hypothetical protein Q31a_61490 [Aureliella helgolandensis]